MLITPAYNLHGLYLSSISNEGGANYFKNPTNLQIKQLTLRSYVNLCTVVVILAVDFPQLFPARFHKRAVTGDKLLNLF